MKRRVVQTIFRTGGGQWLDGSIYYEQKVTSRRSAKFAPTSEAQQRLNEENARRTAVRLLQDNFREGIDFVVHPTYSSSFLPSTPERVAKDYRNFRLRIKRLYKKLGINDEFKYFGTPVGDNKIRKHIHLVITGSKYPNLADEIRKLWPYGYCNVDRVQPDGEYGLAGIANYICENYRTAKDQGENIVSKRWTCSKNLLRPEPQERRAKLPVSWLPRFVAASDEERKAMLEAEHPGYEVVEIDIAQLNDAPEDRRYRIFGNYYVYLRMRRKPEREYPYYARRR